ncbi:MAG: uracil phosphoribosyltransferase, partial [Thermoanaerobacterales bacterium]|nr:uracil phosphoribosyltransferase [Thermoanaerobacterales bacterium]
MKKVFVLDHPLIQHKLALIRDETTGAKDFRDLVEEVSMLMAYEVTRNLPLKDIVVKTPICPAKVKT